MLANSARRLEVVRNCITYIFENKMLEAKKVSVHIRTPTSEVFFFFSQIIGSNRALVPLVRLCVCS